jgi:hypothetical protein
VASAPAAPLKRVGCLLRLPQGSEETPGYPCRAPKSIGVPWEIAGQSLGPRVPPDPPETPRGPRRPPCGPPKSLNVPRGIPIIPKQPLGPRVPPVGSSRTPSQAPVYRGTPDPAPGRQRTPHCPTAHYPTPCAASVRENGDCVAVGRRDGGRGWGILGVRWHREGASGRAGVALLGSRPSLQGGAMPPLSACIAVLTAQTLLVPAIAGWPPSNPVPAPIQEEATCSIPDASTLAAVHRWVPLKPDETSSGGQISTTTSTRQLPLISGCGSTARPPG